MRTSRLAFARWLYIHSCWVHVSAALAIFEPFAASDDEPAVRVHPSHTPHGSVRRQFSQVPQSPATRTEPMAARLDGRLQLALLGTPLADALLLAADAAAG